MPLKLYHFSPSAPSRGALLTARALGLDIEVQEINLFQKEQMNESFIKINPQHTVPTLVDNDFNLWESRAISTYLVDAYAKDDKLYPKDTKKRAICNQRLYFDAASLYTKIRDICYPLLFLGETKVSEEKKNALLSVMKLLNQFLEGHDWLIPGDHFTVADIACIASVSSIMAVGWSNDKPGCENVSKWVKRCQEKIPGYKENEEGAKVFGEFVRSKLSSGESVN